MRRMAAGDSVTVINLMSERRMLALVDGEISLALSREAPLFVLQQGH
jgi:hypothetical protein